METTEHNRCRGVKVSANLQVLDHYRQEGFEFLRRAFNEPLYLEELTGLKQMQQETLEAEVSAV